MGSGHLPLNAGRRRPSGKEGAGALKLSIAVACRRGASAPCWSTGLSASPAFASGRVEHDGVVPEHARTTEPQQRRVSDRLRKTLGLVGLGTAVVGVPAGVAALALVRGSTAAGVGALLAGTAGVLNAVNFLWLLPRRKPV
jgi:hypothetical protein